MEKDYNQERPLSSLGNKTTEEFFDSLEGAKKWPKTVIFRL
jgi:hypothetical protein